MCRSCRPDRWRRRRRVLTMLTRSQGSDGTAYSSSRSASVRSLSCRTSTDHVDRSRQAPRAGTIDSRDPETHHPVLHAVRRVVVVDLAVAQVVQLAPARRSRRRWPTAPCEVHVDRRPARPRATRRVPRRRPRPVRRSGRAPSRCASPSRCRRRGTTARRRRRSLVVEQVRRHPGALRVGQHGDLLAQPGHGVERHGAELRDRVLDPGVLRQQREHAGHQHHPRHCSPRIARCGSRRPAMVLTMSTVCRVSTTSCTR